MSTPAIIVTDHDDVYLEMMRDLLEAEGYPRVLCLHSHEVWEFIVQEEAAGLVIISITQAAPDKAWGLLDKLRLHPPTAKVPVILCATDPRLLREKEEHLARLNCSFLEKPFEITTLLDLVAQMIGPPPGRTT